MVRAALIPVNCAPGAFQYTEFVTRNWRLATFNLESLDERARAPEEFAARIAALRPLLLELDADVLCLQEVNAQGPGRNGPRSFAALAHLMAGTPYAGFHLAHSVHPQSGRPADVHNLVTLSRWPSRQRQVFHDYVPPWMMPAISGSASPRGHEIRFDRPVLIAEIDTPFGIFSSRSTCICERRARLRFRRRAVADAGTAMRNGPRVSTLLR